MGAQITTNNEFVLLNCNLVFLGMKPYQLKEAVTIQNFTFTKNDGTIFVSMLAGVTIKELNQVFFLLKSLYVV